MYVATTVCEDKYSHVRFFWDQHVEKLQHKGMFSRTYQMTHAAFLKFLSLIGPKLAFDTGLLNQTRGAEVIQPDIVMAIALRWLAGCIYVDIRHAYFCSATSIYRCRDQYIDDILTCQALAIRFPETPEEINAAVDGFSARSSNNVICGCIRTLDGFLAKINCPSMTDSASSQDAYFSGHYQCHGLNVQAACDHKLRFIF